MALDISEPQVFRHSNGIISMQVILVHDATSALSRSPFLFPYNIEESVLRSQKYLLERLECYKQPHIAPGVHHCWVSPYTRSGFAPRSSQDGLDPSSIINALLECLPTFPNLTTLSWHCIDTTLKWWSVIQSLKIKNLCLNSSSVPTSPSPLSCRLSRSP